MTKVPVIWVRHTEPGNPYFNKKEGDPILVIGAEGENVLLITKPAGTFIPIFELFSTKSLESVSHKILIRMKALAEYSLTQWGSVGTIFGMFRTSHQVKNEDGSKQVVYIIDVGLACTASELKLAGPYMTSEECQEAGLPYDVEIG